MIVCHYSIYNIDYNRKRNMKSTNYIMSEQFPIIRKHEYLIDKKKRLDNTIDLTYLTKYKKKFHPLELTMTTSSNSYIYIFMKRKT